MRSAYPPPVDCGAHRVAHSRARARPAVAHAVTLVDSETVAIPIAEHRHTRNFRKAQLEQAGFAAAQPTRAVFTIGTAGDAPEPAAAAKL